MADNYLTKYACPTCDKTCDTDREATDHCPVEYSEEVYVCEVCGSETGDPGVAEGCCRGK